MLNIFFGDMTNVENAVFNTDVYFNNTYKDSWITSDFGKRIIKDVDKSDVVSAHLIQSPVLGPISPKDISGGVKTVLLVANDKKRIFNASTCGDNCAKWLLEAAKDKKITINLRHLMNFGDGDFKIKVLNTGKTVTNMYDLLCEAGDFV